MHYYQLNIADYRKDTQHLSPIEHYIYRELIDWYYLDEQEIPKKTQLVLRRLRLVSENDKDLTNVLEEFFIETEKGWKHTRIDAEISKYKAKADTARVNGSKGGRPKKTQSVNLANPTITQKKPDRKLTTNHKPLTNKEKGDKKTTSLPKDFHINDLMIVWFQKQKFSIHINDATERWKDSMQSKGVKYKDWLSAWRNAMRNAQKWYEQDNPNATSNYNPMADPKNKQHIDNGEYYVDGHGWCI